MLLYGGCTVLTIYRRHDETTDGCLDSLKARGLTPEQITLFRDCDCIIWVRGTAEGRYRRESLKTRNWTEALAIVSRAEKRLEEEQKYGSTIEESMQRWLLSCEAKGIAVKTSRNYERVAAQFTDFARKLGVEYVEQITTDLCDQYRQMRLKTVAAPTMQNDEGILSTMFKVAVRRGWMSSNPILGLDRLTVNRNPTLPFNKEEYQRLLLAAEFGAKGKTGGLSQDPVRVKAMLRLMRHTGFRRSDTVAFDPSLCRAEYGMQVYRNQQRKTGDEVIAFIPNDVLAEVKACPWIGEKYPFWSDTNTFESACIAVTDTYASLGERARVTKCHPHRMRDTFAVEALNSGIPIGEVSKLLGHTSIVTTERHYAPWVRSREERLASIVRSRMLGTQPVNQPEQHG